MKKTLLTLAATIAISTTPAFADSDQKMVDSMISCFDSIRHDGKGSCSVDIIASLKDRPEAKDIKWPEGYDSKAVAGSLALANYCYSAGFVPGSGVCKKFK